MAQPSLRVRLNDRVIRLTSDGNRYSRDVATVKWIVIADALPGRARVGLEEGDHVTVRSGRVNADGSVTITQLRPAPLETQDDLADACEFVFNAHEDGDEISEQLLDQLERALKFHRNQVDARQIRAERRAS